MPLLRKKGGTVKLLQLGIGQDKKPVLSTKNTRPANANRVFFIQQHSWLPTENCQPAYHPGTMFSPNVPFVSFSSGQA